MEWIRPFIWSPEAVADLESTLNILKKNGRKMSCRIFLQNYSKHLIGLLIIQRYLCILKTFLILENLGLS